VPDQVDLEPSRNKEECRPALRNKNFRLHHESGSCRTNDHECCTASAAADANSKRGCGSNHGLHGYHGLGSHTPREGGTRCPQRVGKMRPRRPIFAPPAILLAIVFGEADPPRRTKNRVCSFAKAKTSHFTTNPAPAGRMNTNVVGGTPAITAANKRRAAPWLQHIRAIRSLPAVALAKEGYPWFITQKRSAGRISPPSARFSGGRAGVT
jgi:hypothetical protein